MKPFTPAAIKPFTPAATQPFGAPKRKAKTIDELCAGKSELVQKTIRHRKEYEEEAATVMDAGFYFSVVFKTKAERDKFIKDAEIHLIDDSYCYGSDLMIE